MIAVVFPGAAKPYPGEMPAEEGVSLAAPRPLHIPEPEPPRACAAVTKAGEPCKGTPGDDGLCAAHKPKGDGDAAGGVPPALVGADPPGEAAS